MLMTDGVAVLSMPNSYVWSVSAGVNATWLRIPAWFGVSWGCAAQWRPQGCQLRSPAFSSSVARRTTMRVHAPT